MFLPPRKCNSIRLYSVYPIQHESVLHCVLFILLSFRSTVQSNKNSLQSLDSLVVGSASELVGLRVSAGTVADKQEGRSGVSASDKGSGLEERLTNCSHIYVRKIL